MRREPARTRPTAHGRANPSSKAEFLRQWMDFMEHEAPATQDNARSGHESSMSGGGSTCAQNPRVQPVLNSGQEPHDASCDHVQTGCTHA